MTEPPISQRVVVDLTMHPSPHPFVRRGLVKSRVAQLPPTDLVTVRAPGGEILGDAFWNAQSDISLRRLTSGDVRFDRAFLEQAVDRAVSLREGIPRLAEETDAWRVVHAEGDELSGLIVDRYGDVLCVELFSAGWVPWLDELLAMLHERLGTVHHRVSMSERVARLEGVKRVSTRSRQCPKSLRIREHGVRWTVDLEKGHKTGFFCDQRENRKDVVSWVAGKDMLDMCCYTGGFGVTSSVLGEPASVTAVDLDEAALETAKKNAKLNQARVGFVHADAFDWMRQISQGTRRFDVLVLDPPKFIPTRRDIEKGRGKYHDINRLAIQLVKPGGLLLTCSCSGLLSQGDFTDLVRTAIRKENRRARIVHAGGAAPDHPVLLECPETSYLNTLWMRVW
jgi:23S rRNA (cytosine1962-C5)-methyltransferase